MTKTDRLPLALAATSTLIVVALAAIFLEPITRTAPFTQTAPGNHVILNGTSQYLSGTTPTGTRQLREVTSRMTSARIGHGTDQVLFDWTGVGTLYIKAVSAGTTNLQFVPASGTGTTTVNISAFTSGFIYRFRYDDIGPNMAYILEAWDKRGDPKTVVSSIVTASVSSIDPNNRTFRIGAKLDGTLFLQADIDFWRWHDQWTPNYPMPGELGGQSPFPTFAKNWMPCWQINGNENWIDYQFENDLTNAGNLSVTLTGTGSPTFAANTNTAPTAVGEDLTGVAKGRILLNGARSYDYDSSPFAPTNLSDTLSSNWTCTSAPGAGCGALTIRQPTRLATWVDGATTAGTYTFTFAVTDGSLTDSDTVTITVANLSANMGADIACFVDEPCFLDATASAGWDEIKIDTGEAIPGSSVKYEGLIPRTVHRYLTPGAYTAIATAYDAQSPANTATDTATVTVTARAEANGANTEDLTNAANANHISAGNCTADPTGNATKVQNAVDIAKARNTVPQKIILPAGCRADTTVGIIGKVPVGNEMITIISSGTLPASHKRIAPGDTAQMFTIRATGANVGAFNTETTSHHYKLRGLILEANVQQNEIVRLGNPSTEDTEAKQSHHFIVQHCIIRPTNEATVNISNGITYNANDVSLIDSRIEPLSFDGLESHGALTYSAAGRQVTGNNYFGGASSDWFIGGAASTVRGQVPKDIEVRENYFTRPLVWQPSNPSWDGRSRNGKNAWELKTGSYIVSRGNKLENVWTDGQQGIAAFIQATCDAGNWAQANYVDFSYSWFYNVNQGIEFRSSEFAGIPQARKAWFTHNLLEALGTRAYLFLTAWEVRMKHNTALDVSSVSAIMDATMRGPGFMYENSIAFNGEFGWFGSGSSPGTTSLNLYLPGHIFRDSLQVAGSAGSFTAPVTGMQFPATEAAVGFTNPGGGNWSLDVGSIYKGDANDGTDPGVNWPDHQAHLAHTVDGNWLVSAPTGGSTRRGKVANRGRVKTK